MVLPRLPQFAALTCIGLAMLAAAASSHAAVGDDRAEEDVLASVPGEILDTAVTHCRLGEREQAMAMFSAIREQLDPPPALRRLVDDLEASGCSASLFASLRGPRILGGFGYDSNVSQGISARTLSLRFGGQEQVLELDESYRPRGSAFAHAAADWPVALPVAGLNARFAAAARRNQSASEFDVGSVGASLTKTHEAPFGTLRLQGDASALWLGGTSYQGSLGLLAQALVPGDLAGAGGLWIAQASAARVGYRTLTGQDALQTEIGIGREQRLSPRVLAYAEAALQHDNAFGARPGGNRRGYELAAGLVARLGEWQLRPELRFQRYRSESIFAPEIPQRRDNRNWQLGLSAERPLTASQTLLVEWRSRIANDVIPLYTYRAHSLSVAIQHQF